MPSKREIHVDLNCVAVIGEVSNPEHQKEVWGSVARRREYGLRPRTGNYYRNDFYEAYSVAFSKCWYKIL